MVKLRRHKKEKKLFHKVSQEMSCCRVVNSNYMYEIGSSFY